MEASYTNYPKFTPEMKKTHKILIPNMAPVQFRILASAMEREGYTCELCTNDFGDVYADAIACCDRQIADFVQWIQEQDFYENTTCPRLTQL